MSYFNEYDRRLDRMCAIAVMIMVRSNAMPWDATLGNLTKTIMRYIL